MSGGDQRAGSVGLLEPLRAPPTRYRSPRGAGLRRGSPDCRLFGDYACLRGGGFSRAKM